ncbi:ABC transporter permease [Nocardioides sp. GCM10030258]|uniref:ABC transporter permease n=1 Tax=unclassified Nocardioides TaxID=2615069 RepID=UPI0036125EA6
MAAYLSFLVLGLASGAVYAALATGVLTIYKASRVVNFSQGAMAMWGAYVYATVANTGFVVLPIGTLDLGRIPSTGTALLIGTASGLALSLVTYTLVFRPLRHAPALAQVVASVGVLITMQAIVILRFGPESISAPPVFESQPVDVLGTTVSGSALTLAGIAILMTIGLGLYLQYTRYGMATRAASENERSAILSGFSTTRLSVLAWAISGTLSTLMVIFAASTTGLNSTNYTLYVIPALGAVLVGSFRSMTVTLVAALLIGAFQGVVTLMSTKTWWPEWASPAGVSSTLPFVVIVIALFVVGDKFPRRGAIIEQSLPTIQLPKIRPVGLGMLVALYLGILLIGNGTYRFGIITTLILALICFSYVVVTGYLGQVSLAQAAFAGTAGFMLSKLSTSWNVLFPFDLILASVMAGALGLLVAVPAVRIRGTQLAIVTLAAAAVIESFVFNNAAFAGAEKGSPIAQPTLLGFDLGIRSGTNIARVSFGILVLVVVLVVASALIRLLGGSTGRAFLAVRSNERAAAAAGLNVALIKAVGFALSAFIAGLGGCLLGYSRGQLSVASFTVFVGISLLAFAYLGGITSLSGAVVAGVLCPLGLVYTLIEDQLHVGDYYGLVAGLALLLTVIFNPSGMVGATQEMVRGFKTKRPPPGTPATIVPAPGGASRSHEVPASEEAVRA